MESAAQASIAGKVKQWGLELGFDAVRGAAFGMEPVLTQSAYFRPHNKSEDVENLFLVGAGTHPGSAARSGRPISARCPESLRSCQ